jgi:coenzyme PQQ synthesis protein D (PqqD)
VADPLSLVPRVLPGVAVQVIDDDVLVLAGEDLTRLTGSLAATMSNVDGFRSVQVIADLVGSASDAVDELVSRGIVELVDAGPEPRYRRPDHVGVSEDNDVLVLLDLRTGERPVLGSPAAEVWRLLVSTGSVRATVGELELEFPDTPSLAADTAAFVTEMESQGLVERVG